MAEKKAFKINGYLGILIGAILVGMGIYLFIMSGGAGLGLVIPVILE